MGQVTICAPEGRWGALERVLELALETSRDWRRMGVASGLLRFTLAAPWVEEVLLLAEGYSWHWDTEGAGLDPFGYRRLLAGLLGEVGFAEERTDEPDIAASAGQRPAGAGGAPCPAGGRRRLPRPPAQRTALRRRRRRPAQQVFPDQWRAASSHTLSKPAVLFHCHILSHVANQGVEPGGMLTVLKVS